MVRWSWMSRLPRSDSTFLVRMIHRFSTSETDGSGKQRAEHGVLSSGQRVCTGFIGLSFDCLKSFAGARVSKLVLTGAHSTFLNNPYWFQFNLLIFDGQITRNPNFSTGFLPILCKPKTVLARLGCDFCDRISRTPKFEACWPKFGGDLIDRHERQSRGTDSLGSFPPRFLDQNLSPLGPEFLEYV